ncbi:apoptosis-inducing TAF9-like domain 1 family protein [Trichodelitschia bisporula]|uniref:Apoptosis-inducing TAF9-like domain 1 family protein n=1 Tax=Trichodelitschia bisporula TaxID=703511 RepID=A0A6G1I9N2_9PEZI|nr:apoptosis-inducing TAF9-like domain 1 family protein [Trichodelitschia bisporula]
MPPINPEDEERLKSALWFAIGQIIDSTTASTSFNATPQFIGALTELVYTQIAFAARDLEAFAKHAGRTTVNVDDVLLLARRNEGLEGLLRGFVEEGRAKRGVGKGRRK